MRSEYESFIYHDLYDLKEKYRFFYLCLKNYIHSFPYHRQWHFTECIDCEFDGSVFVVTFINMQNLSQQLIISAQKTDSEYHFSSSIKPSIEEAH